jgi:hypothetical protein
VAVSRSAVSRRTYRGRAGDGVLLDPMRTQYSRRSPAWAATRVPAGTGQSEHRRIILSNHFGLPAPARRKRRPLDELGVEPWGLP